MKEADKIALIKRYYAEGKIKKVGDSCYSAPNEFFLLGITPRLVSKALKDEKMNKEGQDV